MCNIFDIANFFINVTISDKQNNSFITNLKLNKLLYFVQGYSLVMTGKPLLNNRIEAWQDGPIIKDIYEKYKVYENKPITSVDKNYSESVFSSEELEVLLKVARKYGKLSANCLTTIVCKKGTPWNKAYVEGDKKNISNDEILNYFKNCEDFSIRKMKYSLDDCIGYHNKEGYLVLPKDDDEDDWNEYN